MARPRGDSAAVVAMGVHAEIMDYLRSHPELDTPRRQTKGGLGAAGVPCPGCGATLQPPPDPRWDPDPWCGLCRSRGAAGEPLAGARAF